VATALFCYLRRTANWHTDVAMPSYEDIKAGTGITSYSEIADAIRTLIEMGFLERRKRFSAPSEYRLLLPRPEARQEPQTPVVEHAPIEPPVAPDPATPEPVRMRAGRAQSTPLIPDGPLPPAKWERSEVVQIKNLIMRRIPAELLDRIIDAATDKTPEQIRTTIEACAMVYSGVRGSTGWEWIDHLKDGTLPEKQSQQRTTYRKPDGNRQRTAPRYVNDVLSAAMGGGNPQERPA
jgi:hypothetical protein